MAYSEDEKKEIFNSICKRIEEGESLRSCLRDDNMPVMSTFFIWLREDENKSKQYARATTLRADAIFDEIIEIADDDKDDEKAFVGANHIQRDRLRIDARKWAISKMNPKKYGEKIDLRSDDGSMSPKPTIINLSNKNIDLDHLIENE